jgi:hypothetical protein
MSEPDTRRRLVLKTLKVTHHLFVGAHISKEAQVMHAQKLTAKGNPNENYVIVHDHPFAVSTCEDGCHCYPPELDSEWIELVA